MTVLLAGLGVVLAGGVLAWVLRRHLRLAATTGAVTAIAGSVAALSSSAGVLISGVPLKLAAEWRIPMASFAMEVDALSAFFLCIIFGLSILAALYGWEYLRASDSEDSHGKCSWLWFNILIVSMALVIMARNAIFFIVAWEIMSMSSFLLVAFESNKEQVRHAAWTYLVATHLGTALLLVMFVLIGTHVGSFDFAAWSTLSGASHVF
ncbi:MAG: proton-conducting transporter membrane subunit, partial [bacterium]